MTGIMEFGTQKFEVLGWGYSVGDLVAQFNSLGTEIVDVFVAEIIYPSECIIKKVRNLK